MNSLTAAGFETTVVNTAGSAKYFSWLPPFGRTLADAEEFSYAGTVQDWLQGRQKLAASFNHAIAEGWVEIKSSPSPIIHDGTTGLSKELTITDDQMYMAQPAHAPGTPPADVLVGPPS